MRTYVPPLAALQAPPSASAIPNPVLKGVVATGELVSHDGKTSGHIAVAARDDGNFDVRMSDFRTSRAGSLDLALSATPSNSTAKCVAETIYFSWGSVSSASYQTFFLEGVTDLTRGDPSFFHTVLLTQPATVADADACGLSVAAGASLTWTMPDLRPNLHVTDSGSRKWAAGKVRMDDGKPASYVVAANDVMTVIAERFGITVDDLMYLNPTRDSAPMAHAGETLNPSKSLR
ncbi:MAG: hypothetical protein QOE16_2160 [Microbacteriaceae bacterium]|nr:hypothetical protein [Microbacteriaceae bacterium]